MERVLREADLFTREVPLHVDKPVVIIDVDSLECYHFAHAEPGPTGAEEKGIRMAVFLSLGRVQERTAERRKRVPGNPRTQRSTRSGWREELVGVDVHCRMPGLDGDRRLG